MTSDQKLPVAYKGIKGHVANLARGYLDNHALREFVKLIPGWAIVEEGIESYLAELRKNQFEEFWLTFFEDLKKRVGERMSIMFVDLLRSRAFIFAVDRTLRAVINTDRARKIKLLAHLLANSVDNDRAEEYSFDEFEEIFVIIDELSDREIKLLSLIANFEDEHGFSPENDDVTRREGAWSTFIDQTTRRLGILQYDLRALLIRLKRSGLYDEPLNTFWAVGMRVGLLTMLFSRVRKLLPELMEVYKTDDKTTESTHEQDRV